MGFDRDAQAAFDEWREALEKRLRDDSEPPTFRAFLSKMRKTVPALALIFHVCELAGTGDVAPIGEKSIVDACAWAEIVESHGRWIYEPRRSRDARDLAKQGREDVPGLPWPYDRAPMRLRLRAL